jgi:opacity protein-like surface antigen
MLMRPWCLFTVVLMLLSSPAWGADAGSVLSKGTKIVTVNVGGGVNTDLPPKGSHTDVTFLNGSVRFGYLPLDPGGPGFLRGTLEVGIEPFVQLYLEPSTTTAEGFKAVFRYHFITVAPIVPYGEFAAGVMHSNLKIKEIRSTHAFSLEGGVGLSYLLTPSLALTGGYRFQHISNASTASRNIGINSNTGVIGASYLFK